MPESYVVGIDGSDGSIRAAQYAIDQASKSNSKVNIIHVLEWSPYSFLTNEELAERHKRRKEELERARSAIIDLVITKLNTGDVEVEKEVRYGRIADEIKRYCDDQGATHIYIGRHGGSGLASNLFGSVAGALVQSADVPVTVVP